MPLRRECSRQTVGNLNLILAAAEKPAHACADGRGNVSYPYKMAVALRGNRAGAPGDVVRRCCGSPFFERAGAGQGGWIGGGGRECAGFGACAAGDEGFTERLREGLWDE